MENQSKDFEKYLLLPYIQIQKYFPLFEEFQKLISNFSIGDEQKEKINFAKQKMNDLLIDVNQLIFQKSASFYELIQIHISFLNSLVRYFIFIFLF